MSTLPPHLVFAIIGSLLVCTTYIYFFAIPESLRVPTGNIGFYGTPNAEFDWCEVNHLSSHYVAEPFNTASSLVFCFTAFVAWQLHKSLIHEARHLLLLHTVNLIGVGSVLFHATLQYKMQLLDELPIYYLILVACWMLYEREKEPVLGSSPPILMFSWAVVVTVVLEVTAQKSTLHQVFRGLMTCSFSLGFLFVFWAASVASAEHAQRLGGDKTMHALFSSGFFCMVFAIVCWLSDNVACSSLQNLPLGIPYPHLHALGWHCGTCVAIYHMALAFIVQRRGLWGKKTRVYRLCFVIPVLQDDLDDHSSSSDGVFFGADKQA